jgi:hypothetical protein
VLLALQQHPARRRRVLADAQRFRNRWIRGHPVDSTQLLYKVFDPVNGYL